MMYPDTELHDSKWHWRFIDLARHVAQWSKDPSTKCGAVIVRPNRTVASIGYNGFPRGADDTDCLYLNRDRKYLRVVHAEVNAILNCQERPEGYAIYIWPPEWGPCCSHCAAAIINAGITTVVSVQGIVHPRAIVSVNEALLLLNEAGITHLELKNHAS